MMGILLSIFFSATIYSQNYAMLAPIGYGASATGGTGGTVVTVTSMSELVTQLKSSGKKIILVSGTLTCSSMQKMVAKDKTVIGLPGATLSNSGRDKSSSGILYFSKGSSNLIIRNLTFKSAGAYDCDGNDNLCFDGVTDAWVDHCDFQDGVDGNFDNKGLTDRITVSWCRFRYLIAPKAGGSGGSDDHRFTNLLGSNASDKPSDGRYNITWAYCWWDNGCKERMVRGRNADLHFLNCYWNSSVANYYIGPENLGAYIEGCTFEGAANSSSKIWKSYGGTNPVRFVNCAGNMPSNSGSPVTPNYSYTALTAAASKTAITSVCGAGATLQVNATTGAVSSSCNATAPILTLTSPAATASQSVLQGSAISNIVYQYSGTATGFNITYSGAATSKPSWLTANISGSTLTFSGTPTGYSANQMLTITIKAITSGSATSDPLTATINITVPAPATLGLTSGAATQTAYIGNNITNVVYTYGGGATGVNVTGLPAGVTANVNNTAKTVTIAGAPMATGTFNYTVTTTGGSTNQSLNGTITVRTPTVLGLPVATYTVAGSTATVSWTAIAGASSYNVKYCSSTGASGTTNKDWDFNTAAYTAGSISTIVIDGATFTSGGSSYSFATGKAKTYDDGFAGGGKVLSTGGNSTSDNGLPTKRFISFAVDGPVKVTAWFFGNSSGDRSIIFSAGTAETETAFVSTDQAPVVATYDYTGSAGTIYVYSDASINISRIKVEPAAASICTEKSVTGLTTTVAGFDLATGSIYVQAVSNTAAYTTGEYAKATAQNVAVNATLALTSAASTTSQSKTTDSELSAITYSYTGTPTVTWTGTANPTTAPAGIMVNVSANTIAITGTPTTAGNFGYTVKTMPINGGTPAGGVTLTGTITVTPAPVNASLALAAESSANAIVNVGDVVDIDYDYTGDTPVIAWSGSSTTKPAGIEVEVGTNYLSIYGVPTVVGTYNYTINVAGLNGGSAAAPQSGTITVNAALIVPTNVTATSTSNSVTVNWDTNTEATAYKVKLCSQQEGVIANEWDFSSWTINASNADANLVVDENNNQRFNYAPAAATPQPIVFANGTVVPDLAGLKFQQTGETKLRLGFGTGQIYLNGSGIKVEIPTQEGDIVTIVGPAGNVTAADRGYTVTNGTLQIDQCINVNASGVMNVAGAVGTWVYTATGTSLTVTTVTGGMNINKITVASAGAAPVCEEKQVSTNSATFNGLANNTEYTYSVQAIRGTETTNFSAERKISTKADDSPQAASIALTSAANTETQTVVAGTAIVPIAYSYTGSSVAIGWTPSTPAGITGTTEITGTPTVPGSYTYTITVSGINGGQSAQASGTITVLAPLTVPANIVANPAQTSINLSWDAVAGAEKYIVNLCSDEETEDTGGGSGEVVSLTLAKSEITGLANASAATSFKSGNDITIGGIGMQNVASSYLQLNNSNSSLNLSSTANDALLIQSSAAAIDSIKLTYGANSADNVAQPYLGYSSSTYTLGTGSFTADLGYDVSQSVTGTTYTLKKYTCPAGVKSVVVARGVKYDGTNTTSTATIRITDITVYLKPTGGTGGGAVTTPVCNTYETNTNSITIPDLTAEKEYSYQVKAVRDVEETAYSIAAKTTTAASKVDPVTPIDITATYGQTLADATLPTGWTWVLPAATSVGNAGNNIFKANFVGDDSYNAVNDVDITIAVSKLNIAKPALTTYSFTYDGTAKSVSLNATGAYALSGQTQTDAGDYQATVTLNDKANTQWADATTADLQLNWSIAAAEIAKPTLTVTTFTYDGSAKSVTLNATNAAYTVSGTQSATNAGDYTVTVTLASTSNYKWSDGTTAALNLPWSINKAVAPSAPSGLTATYGETLSDVTLGTGWTWVNPSAPVGNAGSQLHKANYAGDINTSSASNVDVTVTVSKLNIAKPALAAPVSFTYDGTAKSVSLNASGAYTLSGQTQTNAGSYQATVTLNDKANTQWADATTADLQLNWSIAAAEIAKPTLTVTTFTYDGSAKSVTLNATNAAYTVSGTQSATNAGDYTVTVTLASTSNYKWSDGTTAALNLPWSINKAVAPSAPSGLTATYGETLSDVTLGTGWTWVNPSAPVGNAGSQLHKANYAGDINTSSASNVDVTVTVSKLNIAKPALAAPVSFTYDGTAKSVSLNASGAYTLSGQTQTNAGSYQATVTLNDKANTQWADATTADLQLNWSIAAAEIAKPTLTVTTFTYDGSAKSVTLNATNAAYTVSGTQSATNAGDYTVTVTLASTSNYKWSDGTTAALNLPWSINKAVAPSAPSGLTATYGETLSDVTLPAGWTWVNASASVGNAGIQTHKANYAGDANTSSASNVDVTVAVAKAAAPSAPIGLSATYGQILSNITLPTGWTWVNPSASVGSTGIQTHKANYAGDDNYNAANNVDVTITVNAADSKPAPTGLMATYGQTLSNVTLPTGWTWVNASVSVGTVGNQIHKADFAGDESYNARNNVDVIVTVSKLNVTKPTLVAPIAFTYDGTAKTVSLNATGAYALSGQTQTNAGDYQATVTLNDKANTQWADATTADLQLNWSIAAAEIAKPTLTVTTFTYDGSAKSVTLNATNAAYTVSGTQSATNAGDYTVTVTLASTSNYKWSDGTTAALNLPWSINKAVAPSAPSGLTATYGETLSDVTLPAGWTWVNASASVGNAGIQTHKANYAGDANTNNATNVDINVFVNKASIVQPALVTNLFVYDGNLKSVVLTATNTAYTLKGKTSATDAGNYLAAVELTDKVNTQWIDGSTTDLPLTWDITKAPAPVSTPAGLTATVGETLSDVELPTGWTWVNPSTSVGEAGEQTYQANYDGGNNYESLSNVDITITVQIQTIAEDPEANKLQIIKTATELRVTGVEVSQICLYGISGQYFGCVNGPVMDISSLIKGTSYIAQIRSANAKVIPYKFIK